MGSINPVFRGSSLRTARRAAFGRSRGRRGFTRLDMIALVAMLGVALGCILPALAQTRNDERILKCQQNLRKIATSANSYALDHKGKFYRHWFGESSPPWPKETNFVSAWWDENQCGAYLDDLITIYNRRPSLQPDDRFAEYRQEGLGAGIMFCPGSDEELRSYNMNFWASGIDPPKTLPDWPAHYDRITDAPRYPGSFFDTDSVIDPEVRLLFGEALALASATAKEIPRNMWATEGYLGNEHLPGERFAGVNNLAVLGVNNGEWRWGRHQNWPSRFDYGRHGGFRGLSPERGNANFAFVDGHVDMFTATDLYDHDTRRSTFRITWSNVDRELEEQFRGESR